MCNNYMCTPTMTVKQLQTEVDSLKETYQQLSTKFSNVVEIVNATKTLVEGLTAPTTESFRTAIKESQDELSQQIDNSSQRILEDVAAIRKVVNDRLLTQNERLARENRDLRSRVSVVESRLASLEQLVNNIDNHARKSNVVISGIPASVGQNELTSTVATILDSLADREVTENDIEACHRLNFKQNGSKATIVRAKRNILDPLRLKSNHTREKMKDAAVAAGFPPTTQLYLNDNKSSNMEMLAYNARLLASEGLIDSSWWYNASVRIKTLGGKFESITHESQLRRLFPEFRKFTFDVKFCDRLCYGDDNDMEAFMDLDGNWEVDETISDQVELDV